VRWWPKDSRFSAAPDYEWYPKSYAGEKRMVFSPMLTGATLVLAGLLGGFVAALSTPSHSDNAQSIPPVVQKLVTKDAIREKLLRYSLLHDGDGAGRNGRLWAEAEWTDDATFQVIYPDGTPKLGNGDIGIQGREAIYQTFGELHPPEGLAVRHVILDPAFDSITGTTASTRTIEIVVQGQSIGNPLPEPTHPQSISAYVMHDVWKKSADGEWRKSRSLVYCTVWCPELLPPPTKVRASDELVLPLQTHPRF
jgi:hypothetical protein